MIRLLLLLFLSVLLPALQSCDNSSGDAAETSGRHADSVALLQTEDEDGPPFENECKANFYRFGEYKINNNNCHVYYCGKGWNPKFYSCSWVWGELINNEFSDDTNVTAITIHLLDLDRFTLPQDGTEYGNDSIKNYVIAVYGRNSEGGNAKSIFDPFKTGKYPKPEQWIE